MLFQACFKSINCLLQEVVEVPGESSTVAETGNNSPREHNDEENVAVTLEVSSDICKLLYINILVIQEEVTPVLDVPSDTEEDDNGRGSSKANNGALNNIPMALDQATILWCNKCHKVQTNKKALEEHLKGHEVEVGEDDIVALVKVKTLFWPAKILEKENDMVSLEVFNREKSIVKESIKNF